MSSQEETIIEVNPKPEVKKKKVIVKVGDKQEANLEQNKPEEKIPVENKPEENKPEEEKPEEKIPEEKIPEEKKPDADEEMKNQPLEKYYRETGLLKKLTFIDAYDMVNKASNDKISKSSTSLDILAIYMKGQKTLYTEAKTYCEQKLNSLMLPAIFISSLCVVLGTALDGISWGKTLVASLNSFNVFLLAIISYLKLDARAEAHKTSAYKYDKIQSHCEFLSGRTLFYSETAKDEAEEKTNKEAIKNMINDIEARVTEVKESNQFILPEYIRYKYPVLFSTNVFAEVKKLQNQELVLINEFKELVNESIIHQNIRVKNENIFLILGELDKLINLKLKAIILHKNKFLDLDEKFSDEMDEAIKQSKRACCRTNFFST
jgi:hypothetical protein